MPKKMQVKYKKAPQAPRRFKSSYMFFSTEKHKTIRKELAEKGGTEKLSTTEVAKMVSQAWKDLPDDGRQKWEELAKKDKARYEMEKTMYTGPWIVPATKRTVKDPNAPKRPMSAFLSFSNSKRAAVKSQHPDVPNAEISRILSQMWKDASEEERKIHIDKEFKLRQEYKVAIAEWRQNSENEMQAARKEREDQAMKAVLEGKEAVPKMLESREPLYYHNFASAQPTAPPHSDYYHQHQHHGARAAAPPPHYYPPPTHHYYGGANTPYGENTPMTMMHPYNSYHDRSPQPFGTYGHPEPQMYYPHHHHDDAATSSSSYHHQNSIDQNRGPPPPLASTHTSNNGDGSSTNDTVYHSSNTTTTTTIPAYSNAGPAAYPPPQQDQGYY